jgi:iron complex transport system ATP-binding protein
MTYAATGVSVRVAGATLLEHVSVAVAAGEVVAVAGPNGAGKSTLVATLAGDRSPSSGLVSLAGVPLRDWSRAELARRRAVASAEASIAFGYRADDVALLGRLPWHGGRPTATDRAIVRGLLAEVDCGHLAGRVFATLSTGERQRVAMARAVAQVTADEEDGATARPADAGGDTVERFLLLDEPTSSLDPAHQHLAMRLLRREASRGRGVLVVLHDLNLAAAYADRIILLSRGRVAADGPPREVLRSDLLERVFGIPMLVLPHPHLAHPLVVAEPHVG